MSSRLRWYILGNLIGITILILGILVINRYRAGQEVPPTQQIEQQTKPGEESEPTKKENPGPDQDEPKAE